MLNVTQLARRCMQVDECGNAPWSVQQMGRKDVVRLLHILAQEVIGESENPSLPAYGLEWTDDQREELRCLYNGGASVESLAVRFGRTRNGIRASLNHIRKHGGEVGRKGRERK